MDDFFGSRTLRDRRYAASVPQDIEVRCGKLERSRKLAERIGYLDYGQEPASLPEAYKNDYALMYAILGRKLDVDTSDNERTKRWRDLITQYSRRDLKYATDALLAIAGLAATWVASFDPPPRYLAGLWEDDLLRGVLWKCLERDDETDRPQEYLAPTWSWASIRRAIDWLPANEVMTQPKYHITIKEATCATSLLSLYGRVSGGHMVVHGPFVKATIRDIEESGGTWSVRAGKSTSTFEPDCIPEVMDMARKEIFCLWWSTDVNDARTGMGWERALVLKTGDGEKNYDRVGIMEHFAADEWREWLEEGTFTIF